MSNADTKKMKKRNAHSSTRREFLGQLSFGTLFLMTGGIKSISAATVQKYSSKVTLRFAVASDAHYGQPKTEFDAMIEKVIGQINLFGESNPLDFTVINGDIIHNEKEFLPKAKAKLEVLKMPWHITRGNHDMVSDAYWKEVWNKPLNYETSIKKYGLIFGDTSNEKGEYLSPDLLWLKDSLEKHRKQKQVFIFLHIPQAKWTKNGIETPAFFELLKQYPNIKAVFHGHEHDQDGVKMNGNIPFIFDSHIGGNWGTEYKGFRVVEILDDGSMITYMMDPNIKKDVLTF